MTLVDLVERSPVGLNLGRECSDGIEAARGLDHLLCLLNSLD
jgi:hypothetical protein